jgi:hypothetical protein
MERKNFKKLDHLLYSPDMTSCKISSYSQNRRLLCRATEFQTLVTPRDMQQPSSRAFWNGGTSNVLDSGNIY